MKLKRQTARATLIACLGLSVLTYLAGSSPASAAPSLTTVNIGVLGNAADAPFFVADTSGYFAAEGIKADFHAYQSGADMIPLVAAGKLDVGWGEYSAGMFNALGQGIDLKLVASAGWINDQTTSGLFVSAKSGITATGGVKQLVGKTLAVNGSGIASQAYLHMILKKAGIPDSAVKFKILSFADQFTALASGAVDGAFLVDPLTTIVTEKHIASPFLTNYQMAGKITHQVGVVMYSPSFAKETSVGTAFMTAYLKASNVVSQALSTGSTNAAAKQAVAKALTAHTSTPTTVASLAIQHETGGSGQIQVKSAQMFLTAFQQMGLIDVKTVDLQKYIDESFANAAQKALGTSAG